MVEPVSVYIHVPFCTKKCDYCHFYVIPNLLQHQKLWFASLKQEWELVAPTLANHPVITLYFGGGTPSLLPPEWIAEIVSWFNRPLLKEVTLEANPETVTLSLMQQFKSAGIDRVSIGVQSFQDPHLITLGRTHLQSKAVEAVLTTFEAGIQNLSIDLMYDLPGQSLKQWEASLIQATSLPIQHLSLYNLTFEPQTVFYKKRAALKKQVPSDDDSKQMLQLAIHHLEAAGLLRYEISAFAKPGFEAKHNTGYWIGRPFQGLGPSAFSYWGGKRFQNVANLHTYAQKLSQGIRPTDFSEELSKDAQKKELLAIAVRLKEGVDLHDFETKYGPLPKETKKALLYLEQKGWIENSSSHPRLSSEGLLFYDSVAEELI